MGLISPDQRTQIKNGINSVTDTFMQKPLVYKRYSETLDRFNENRRPAQQLQSYSVLGFIVWGELEGDKTTMDADGNGGFDESTAYVLFNIKDLIAVGLVDSDKNFIGKANTDYIVDQNEELRVIGHTLIGQLIDENLLIKIYIEKQINNG